MLGAAIAPVVVLVTAGATPSPRATDVQIDLYQDGVATAGPGVLLRLPAGMGATYLEGSRVLDPAALDPAWLTDGIDPSDGEVNRLSQVAGSPATAGRCSTPRAPSAPRPPPGRGSPTAGSPAPAPASRGSARTPCSTCTP